MLKTPGDVSFQLWLMLIQPSNTLAVLLFPRPILNSFQHCHFKVIAELVEC